MSAFRHFSFYDPQTGELTGDTVGSTDPRVIELNVSDKRPAIEGLHNRWTHRVDLGTKKVVPKDTPG